MKNRTLKTLLVSILLLLIIGSLTAGAIVPYATYTYSYHGLMQESPAAYVPLKQITTNTLIYSLSAEGKLTIPFSATQNYVAGGYAADLNTMVAVSSGVTDTNLSFQPVCAYLCVKLWGKDHSVKSITLTSKGGEALSGNGVVTPHYNAVPTCVLSGSANTIKLNCGEVAVGTTEAAATEFWFVVPPVALQQGYTIKVVDFYSGVQSFEQEATTFVSGTTYNITAELTVTSDGPGMGVGGWGDGGENGGSAD